MTGTADESSARPSGSDTAPAPSGSDTAPAPSGSPATDFAVQLLADLLDAGVADVVLSPGSRSQALALAAAEFERAGRVRLHVRLDERSAGFLALGIAVESGLPTAIVTTSGTAVANLHPAVLEAHHSGVPLILLTADRPAELRGIGSNQTTHQPRLFGESLRLIRDVEAPLDTAVDASAVAGLVGEAVSASLGRSSSPGRPAAPGPVQVNIAFREPLSAAVTTLPPTHATEIDARAAVALDAVDVPIDIEPVTVVIAGHAAGPRAEEVARLLGAPLLAEVSSGARFGPNNAPAFRELLDDPEFGGRIRRAIVFGHPTLTRQIPALLQRPGVEVVVVRSGVPEAYDPGRNAQIVEAVRVVESVSATEADPATESNPATESAASPDANRPLDPEHRAWVGSWVHTGRALVGDDEAAAPDVEAAVSHDKTVRAAFLRGEVDVIRRPITRRSLVEALWRVTWPHDRLVLGASRLIREADVVVPGKKIAVHSNRGLAGIDGTIATATGIALASQAGRTAGPASGPRGWADGSRGITRVLVGDLTLLHDAGSLLLGEGEARPRIQVIVGNDVGGTIFDGLEVARVAPADAMMRVQLTPQNASFELLASAYGWQYTKVSTQGDLNQALVGSTGPILIEVPLPR